MLFTAAEMEKRGRLTRIICGAYPTEVEQTMLRLWPFKNSRKLNRFANRTEKFPSEKVRQSRISEILSSIAGLLSKLGVGKDRLNIIAFKIYGKVAAKALQQIANEGVKIYHYRAGFGQSSVAVAKKLGMKAICDHSIVHPSLLQLLVDNKGAFPNERPGRPNGIWGAVLDDIEAADLVVVNSDFVAETFKFMGFDQNKLSVVYQGVEDKFFDCLPKEREFYSTNIKRPLRFMFAGGMVQRKGLDELQEAILALSETNFELHLAGSLTEEAKFRYAKLLSDSRVTYHGMLSQKALAAMMSKSDVFIFPSRAEGSARVIFEAMGAGCAVICTENSGSIVKDGKGGRIIPVNDQHALINAIKDVLNYPEKYKEYGKSNRELILTSFRQKNYGENFTKIYDDYLLY
jgi:glycosyltransferase involved in cell wall biosynthesis